MSPPIQQIWQAAANNDNWTMTCTSEQTTFTNVAQQPVQYTVSAPAGNVDYVQITCGEKNDSPILRLVLPKYHWSKDPLLYPHQDPTAHILSPSRKYTLITNAHRNTEFTGCKWLINRDEDNFWHEHTLLFPSNLYFLMLTEAQDRFGCCFTREAQRRIVTRNTNAAPLDKLLWRPRLLSP